MNGAHEIDMKHRIRVACYGLGFDLASTHALATFKMWEECATTWPPDSPAALGCLLALVREAWGIPGIHTFMEGGRWWVAEDSEVMLGDAKTTYGGDTEAEALVAALEAAPQPGAVTP